MSRVSENSSSAALNFSLGKAKSKLEDLQMKGATLKDISRPSDNPISNVEALSITSNMSDNKQYQRNADYALLHLNVTEKSLEQLTDLLVKAKEIAISQSSDFYNADVRKNIANEVNQLRNLALSIANKRVGQKYIFSGYSTLTQPFDVAGKYNGDKGHTTVEVAKDFFLPLNLNGHEIFYSSDDTSDKNIHPLKEIKEPDTSKPVENKRELASTEGENFHKRDNIFAQLESLSVALETNDAVLIQNLLEEFDDSISRLITLRTRVGSITSSVMNSKSRLESENIEGATRKSKLVDADIAEVFSDITKHQSVLKTTYQSSQGLMNQNLMDFLR
ncbi:putative flagellar hook-associated protein 3 [Halobacteriovorax marinus SJ]|uniref:Flagellar hook-associated protein 3 n=1 Tax=Halobacteriovorax marinus (strain ATCC BAA-682 / DSM 15412 / SJ) TaxID=862908 RepID=E1X133_HALMS|nr:flagellar hook-associated protein FlgL [Halobacteriovorax marinus]CBW28103.1 putative flagellar hook-associated protein 3 [Halobacteriovorax marinus SJ]